MKLSKQEYRELAERRGPGSRVGRNMGRAFLVGGLICVLGQAVRGFWAGRGLSPEDAGTAAGVTLIALGVLLTGLGVYDRLAKFAGAGTLVPITGFANAVAAPAIEFKTEGLVTGTAVKLFTIAGPVIVYGTAAAMAYGVLLMLL